jgi:hypothetical protein
MHNGEIVFVRPCIISETIEKIAVKLSTGSLN